MPIFRIKDVFKITGRGHVLSGNLTDKEIIHSGDKALISVDNECFVLKIIGVSIEKEEGHLGLLVSFKDFNKLGIIDLTEKEIKILNVRDRQKLANGPIEWTGDLSDDCTAIWAGLMLRAEWMDEDYWWWTVYDMLNGQLTIDSSNNYNARFVGGENSRRRAVQIAKEYLNVEK